MGSLNAAIFDAALKVFFFVAFFSTLQESRLLTRLLHAFSLSIWAYVGCLVLLTQRLSILRTARLRRIVLLPSD